jgi:hypothetical protein
VPEEEERRTKAHLIEEVPVNSSYEKPISEIGLLVGLQTSIKAKCEYWPGMQSDGTSER